MKILESNATLFDKILFMKQANITLKKLTIPGLKYQFKNRLQR